MFNSFGNLAVDPRRACCSWTSAPVPRCTCPARAELEWVPPGAAGDDGGTGRRVRFTPERIVQPVDPLPIHVSDTNPYPRNPRLS